MNGSNEFFCIYHADLNKLGDKFKVDTVDQIQLEPGNRIPGSPKLYRCFRITHSTQIPGYYSEVKNPEDSDYKFVNNKAIYDFLFPNNGYLLSHQFDRGISFGGVTNAIKDKIIEAIWLGSPKKMKSEEDKALETYIPQYYFATLKDHHGNKKFMTVGNLFVSVVNGNIEQSVVITDTGRQFDETHHLICSASLCLISDRPIYQFQ